MSTLSDRDRRPRGEERNKHQFASFHARVTLSVLREYADHALACSTAKLQTCIVALQRHAAIIIHQ